jgi:hypothetical protein
MPGRTVVNQSAAAPVGGGSGPGIVYTQAVTGIVASNTSSQTVFTPIAGAVYRATASVTCTTTGTAATMAVQTLFDAANIGATASSAVGCGTVGLTGSSTGMTNPPATADTIGWKVTLTNAIGAAAYRVDFVVERLA